MIRPMTLEKAQRVFKPAGDRQCLIYRRNKIVTSVCAKRGYGVAEQPDDTEGITDSLSACARASSAESTRFFVM
jgi:hypothetical protein